jgi:hypothetical protein
MSEETTMAESASEGPGARVDPVAASLALDGAERDEASAFLRDQRKFIATQSHRLGEQHKQPKSKWHHSMKRSASWPKKTF